MNTVNNTAPACIRTVVTRDNDSENVIPTRTTHAATALVPWQALDNDLQRNETALICL